MPETPLVLFTPVRHPILPGAVYWTLLKGGEQNTSSQLASDKCYGPGQFNVWRTGRKLLQFRSKIVGCAIGSLPGLYPSFTYLEAHGTPVLIQRLSKGNHGEHSCLVPPGVDPA